MKYIYDIFLGDYLVGTQGDYRFNTKEEAEEDAKDYILNGLMESCNKKNLILELNIIKFQMMQFYQIVTNEMILLFNNWRK